MYRGIHTLQTNRQILLEKMQKDENNLKPAICKIYSDERNVGYNTVFAIIKSGNHVLGVCIVGVDDNKIVEISGIGIYEKSDRRKGYGTKLWRYIEDYVIKKYNPIQFEGDLEVNDIPAVNFWDKQNFQFNRKQWTIIKKINY